MEQRERLKRIILIVFIVGFFGAGVTMLWVASLKAPDLRSFETRKVEQSTKIYDQTGEVLLYDLHKDVQRTVISSEDISRNVKNATVAIEDAEFYEHNGIKVSAILRAVFTNTLIFLGLSDGFTQGGSTITQQVVKNSVLVSDRTIARKIKEWALAIKLDQAYSKEQILEFYLNETPYGGNLYGIEEASNAFFDKSASDLTIAESAYLAALPQAPTYYSPFGNNRDALETRKDLVLKRMLEERFISDEEYEEANKEEVIFERPTDTGIRAPHFVFFVIEQLEKKYGKRALEERGFRIITTLDYELQETGEEIVRDYALRNEDNFNAENAALVAIDPHTGGILTMIGSRDYFDPNIDGNFNVAVAPNRQPGSSFKPFVYAQALRRGYTTETVVFDLETQFSTACNPDDFTDEGECYTPGNYDHVFRGPVTFREALAQSINIPAIKVFYLAGLQESLSLARSMGIQSLTDIARYGLTLVLGGGEVSLLEMTSAYSVFANEGVRNPHTAILRIEDKDGNIIEELRPQPRRVLEEQTALWISDMLSDNEARTPAFGSFSPLYFPGYDVAAKTGTTNESRDAWIIGYTPNIAVGTWAGNNNNRPMVKEVAGFIVAPMWNAFMKEALKHEEYVGTFTNPTPENEEELKPFLKGIWEGGNQYIVDSISGKLATQYTPQETRETRVVRNIQPILYWVDKENPRGPAPQDPTRDRQFPLWAYSVYKWSGEQGYTQENDSVIPTEIDDVHTPQNIPSVSITSPIANTFFNKNDRVTVTISSTGTYGLTRVSYLLNGQLIGSSNQSPFSFSFVPNDVGSHTGKNTLTVQAQDAVFNQGTAQVTFQVN